MMTWLTTVAKPVTFKVDTISNFPQFVPVLQPIFRICRQNCADCSVSIFCRRVDSLRDAALASSSSSSDTLSVLAWWNWIASVYSRSRGFRDRPTGRRRHDTWLLRRLNAADDAQSADTVHRRLCRRLRAAKSVSGRPRCESPRQRPP